MEKITKSNTLILQELIAKIKQHYVSWTVLTSFKKGGFYVKLDQWHRGDSLKFDCFYERYGTRTYPAFSVKLESYEQDADTLLIKIVNQLNNNKFIR